MKKSIFFWLYFVLSIILAIYFAVRIITSQMGRGPVSRVQHIETYGANTKDKEIIKLAIGVTPGNNLRGVDLHQLNYRVSNIPGVKKSAVRLLPNGDIIVKIQKHNVIATWSDGSVYYPLSADGVKIDTPSLERKTDTIVFQGDLPEDLTGIINSVSAISDYIDYMNMVESRRWNIHTKNGTTIYLPENDPAAAINKISVLNQTHKLLSRNLEIIDMRDSARILVKEKK
ncbi:MAG: cell division protein FtsQ/DivIB [Alphaproteobacteria bacterium]|nr:cell division protein FtsQ/DivIB [Alphaproteobacteria bacterium]MBR0212947.1 cell division protein FtsQ/DivIB [Alphaproteobacteria bacterium]